MVISKEDKAEWKAFAKEIGLNITMLIRLAVKLYIKNNNRQNNPTLSLGTTQKNLQKIQMDDIQKEIKALNEKLMANQQEDVEEKEILEIEKVSIQIVNILNLKENQKGLSHKTLALYCGGISRVLLNKALQNMQKNTLINVEKGLISLR